MNTIAAITLFLSQINTPALPLAAESAGELKPTNISTEIKDIIDGIDATFTISNLIKLNIHSLASKTDSYNHEELNRFFENDISPTYIATMNEGKANDLRKKNEPYLLLYSK